MTREDREEVFRGLLLLVLLAVLLWRYVAEVADVMTPFTLAVLIAFVAFTMRVKWARGVAIFVAALGIMWFVNYIWQLLFPFIAAFFLAYFLSPAVAWLEKRKVPRSASAFVLILVALGIVVGLLALAVPPLVSQIGLLLGAFKTMNAQLTSYLAAAREWLASLQEYEMLPVAQPVISDLVANLEVVVTGMFEKLARFVTGLSKLGTHIINVIIIPIITYYLLRDMPKIKAYVGDRIPRRYEAEVRAIVREADRVLSGWLRGQFILSTVEGVFVGLALTAIGVEYAVLLGIFAGFANMIPYVGTYVGAIPALIVILIGPEPARQLIWGAGLYVVINIFDSYVLAPRIVGSRVGLHPVIAMIAMLVGAKFFGVVGFLIATPVAGILNILYRRLEKRYLRGPIFNDPPDEVSSGAPGGGS